QFFPFQGGAIANALNFQALFEAVGDALDHVRDQAAGEPVQGTVLAAVGRAGDGDDAVLLLDLHVGREGLPQLALRALDGDVDRADLNRDGVGDGDGLSSDPAHLKSPNVGDDLAADSLRARFVAGHHAGGSADDRGAGPALHARDVFVVDVAAATRARDPFDPEDHRLAL